MNSKKIISFNNLLKLSASKIDESTRSSLRMAENIGEMFLKNYNAGASLLLF